MDNVQDGKNAPEVTDPFLHPMALYLSKDGKLYFITSHSTIKVISKGGISTIAGWYDVGFRDGKAEKAMFHFARGICVSDDGKIYIADKDNHCIRRITGGIVSTIAGDRKPGFRDGAAQSARFNDPHSIFLYQGDLYITDRSNHRIRKISFTFLRGTVSTSNNCVVSTIAGCGQAGFRDGNAQEAMFNEPAGIFIANDGSIYVADSTNDRIRMISNGMVSTIAGCGTRGYLDGNALEAKLSWPCGITGYNGNIYFTDYHGNRIRMISNGIVSTIAGCGKTGYKDGKAEEAMFDGPNALSISEDGKIFVSDSENGSIRVILNGMVSSVTTKGVQAIDVPNRIDIWEGDVMAFFPNSHRFIEISQSTKSSISRFGLSSLLSGSKSVSDMTLTINNHEYHLHSVVVQSLCPMVIKHISTIEDAKISNESLQIMFEMIYSNDAIKIANADQYEMTDLTHLIELTWLFESFEIRNESFVPTCIEKFEAELNYFMKEEYKLAMNQTRTLLFNRLHDLIVLSDSNGLRRRMLTNLLDFTIDQIKKYFQNHRSERRRNVSNLNFSSMFVLLGLHTEPTIIDEPFITSKAISEYLQAENMSIQTQPDYTIMTHDRSYQIKCHKVILYAKWSYFRRMIESGLLESASGEMIMSDDWNATRLFDFVKYLYTHEVGFESVEDSTWLLKNAKLYELIEKSINKYHETEIALPNFEQLIRACSEKVFQPISPENCCAMYKVSLEIGTPSREKECYSYLVKNVIELMKNQQTAKELLEFGPEFLSKLFAEYHGQK